jgi:FdhD protein
MQSDAHSVRRFSVRRIQGREVERVLDAVAVEEPLEIRIRYVFKGSVHCESFAVTMRTPGNDRELAAGLLVSEGIVRNRGDLADIRPLGREPSNEILAELAADVDFEAWRTARQGIITSSCGVCGKRSREAISQHLPDIPALGLTLSPRQIFALPELLRLQQQGFGQTGGLHGAALISAEGRVQASFEDIGRHNALDKVIGWALLNGRLPLHNHLLFMSSRSSFELIQKAGMAGAPVLATVGGASSLAIETAREIGLTLIGFVRGQRCNVYAGEWRIHSEMNEAAFPEQQPSLASESD